MEKKPVERERERERERDDDDDDDDDDERESLPSINPLTFKLNTKATIVIV